MRFRGRGRGRTIGPRVGEASRRNKYDNKKEANHDYSGEYGQVVLTVNSRIRFIQSETACLPVFLRIFALQK
jgi:hypothetical protein